VNYKLGKNTTENLETLLQSGKPASKILVNAVKGFIHDTPIDFCIIENGGYRTAELQKQLYDLGNSRCDGYLNKSEHQSGLAVDLVPWVNGRPVWKDGQCERKHAFYLAGAFLTYCNRMDIPITSGADWNGDGNLQDGWDPCHFQIKDI
jgi:hypothetical protein